ncbi:MAG: hypothetical protein QM704_24250 [Anaeromyxobacteraceae bacterium]
MRKGLLAGLAGIVLLAAGGVWLVLSLEGPVKGPGAAPAPEAAAPAPLPQIVLPNASPPPPPREAPPKPREPGEGTAKETLPADLGERAAALQAWTAQIQEALHAYADRVRPCRLLHAELLLGFESLDRRVRVVEVKGTAHDPKEFPAGVPVPPPEDPGAVDCARRQLQDVILSVPAAREGRRWEMIWVVE